MPGTQPGPFTTYHRALLYEGHRPINHVSPPGPYRQQSEEPEEHERPQKTAGVSAQAGGDIGDTGDLQDADGQIAPGRRSALPVRTWQASSGGPRLQPRSSPAAASSR